jgi:hypothetical protein
LPEIVYEPITKIVIHEIVELDSASLFDEVMRGAVAQQLPIQPTINWSDGVAFVSFPLDTDDAENDRMEGMVHFASVIFSRMPFQSEVKVKLDREEMSVRLRKVEHSHMFRDMARFLRDFKDEPDASTEIETELSEE